MKKAELVEAFLKHHTKMLRHKSKPSPDTKPTKKSSSSKLASKPKLTKLDKEFGLDKPLYKKGVAKGAKEQFEKRYGKIQPKAKPVEKVSEGRPTRTRKVPKRFQN